MRGLRPAALLVTLAASLALPGCFGPFSPDDVASRKVGPAPETEMGRAVDELSSVDYSKASRLVVRDSAGGVVREVTDQGEIEKAVSPLSGASGLADGWDATVEYVIEVWQPETIKAGQDEADAEEAKVLELTVYEGSPVVTLEVSPIGLRLDLDPPEGVADGLRALAE